MVDTDVLVIGGGIAGCMAAYTWANQGAQVLLLEAGETLAAGASGNHSGALYPQLTADSSRLGRLYAAALRFTPDFYQEIQIKANVHFFNACGLIMLPRAAADISRFIRIAGLPDYAGLVEYIQAPDISRLAGMPLSDAHALYLPTAGMLQPSLLCVALCRLASDRLHCKIRTKILSYQRDGSGWRVMVQTPDASVATIHTHKIVIAAGYASKDMLSAYDLPLRPVRGQITTIAATSASQALRAVLCRQHYVLPAVDGWHAVGSSYQRENIEVNVRICDDNKNIRGIATTAPIMAQYLMEQPHYGRAAIRCTTPDHYPIIATLAEGLQVFTGLGSRGLLSAPYLAQRLLHD